ncbi:MAG: response regulator [Bacillota bacterium]
MYENYRVLFVDDEPNILSSLRRGLMDEEYYCFFASSGKEALEIISKEKIAVVVTDMRMPEMNGLELLLHVTEISPMTVKVVLTGYTQLPQILVTINQVDIFKFLTKPWELEEMIQVIKKSLDYYIIQEENANYKKVLEAKNKSYQNILKKINEIIEEEKTSRELLRICGKEILGFGRDFRPEEKKCFEKLLPLQENLFELFSQAVTTQKKEMETTALIDYLSEYISSLNPDTTIEKIYGETKKINLNLKMIETAIEALWIVFSEEIKLHGLYSKLENEDNFSLTLLAMNVEPEDSQFFDIDPPFLDMKNELVNAVLEKMMDFCEIKFQIIKLKGNLIIKFVMKN